MNGAGSDTRFVFTTPSGREIESSCYPQFPQVSAESSRAALTALAPGVDARTAVTAWRGESCDYGMAIEALLLRDGKNEPLYLR